MSFTNYSIFQRRLSSALKKVERTGADLELRHDRNYYLIGNGGSATIAQHIAVDMIKGGYSATAQTDPAVMSMWANDVNWESAYAGMVAAHIGSNDYLIAISSSGESKNIINGCKVAFDRHAHVVTLSGFAADNTLRIWGEKFGHCNFYVPSKNYGVVEIAHLAILHAIVNPGT